MQMQNQKANMDMLSKIYGGGAKNAMKAFGGGGATAATTASEPLQGLGAFLSPAGRQLGSGIPSLGVSPYSAPSVLAPAPQPSFNLFGNLPQPR